MVPYRVKTMDYTNKKGIVTAITDDELMVIDGETVFINTAKSQRIMDISRVDLGDSVEYNTNSVTRELIYLRVMVPAPNRRVGSTSFREEGKDRVAGYYVGGGEMANMTLASHDPYDEWADGDTM
jgi:hypothetical protein